MNKKSALVLGRPSRLRVTAPPRGRGLLPLCVAALALLLCAPGCQRVVGPQARLLRGTTPLPAFTPGPPAVEAVDSQRAAEPAVESKPSEPSRPLQPSPAPVLDAAAPKPAEGEKPPESDKTVEETKPAEGVPPEPAPPEKTPVTPPPPPMRPVNILAQLTPSADGYVSLEKWLDLSGLGRLAPRGVEPESVVTLRGKDGDLTATPGSHRVSWGGIEVWLAFPPRNSLREVRMHALDIEKTVAPLLGGAALDLGTNRTVVIDPGHGGQNRGARSAYENRAEKEFTLDWARRLVPLLERQGWRVLLTRTGDTDLSLPERVAFAETNQAALFISLHFNSTNGQESQAPQAGIETYCLTPAGLPSSLVREVPDDPDQVFPNNALDTQNLSLAVRLHRALVGHTGEPDRGVRRARFMGVLRNQNRPAVLLEAGYLSNLREARLIGTIRYRQQLAEAVAAGLSLLAPEPPIQVGAAGP